MNYCCLLLFTGFTTRFVLAWEMNVMLNSVVVVVYWRIFEYFDEQGESANVTFVSGNPRNNLMVFIKIHKNFLITIK